MLSTGTWDYIRIFSFGLCLFHRPILKHLDKTTAISAENLSPWLTDLQLRTHISPRSYTRFAIASTNEYAEDSTTIAHKGHVPSTKPRDSREQERKSSSPAVILFSLACSLPCAVVRPFVANFANLSGNLARAPSRSNPLHHTLALKLEPGRDD